MTKVKMNPYKVMSQISFSINAAQIMVANAPIMTASMANTKLAAPGQGHGMTHPGRGKVEPMTTATPRRVLRLRNSSLYLERIRYILPGKSCVHISHSSCHFHLPCSRSRSFPHFCAIHHNNLNLLHGWNNSGRPQDQSNGTWTRQ